MIDTYGRELVDEMTSQNKIVRYDRVDLELMIEEMKIEIKEQLERIGQ